MEIQHTPMTEIIKKDYKWHIRMESTIATAQYENYKPCLEVDVPIEDVAGTLRLMRKILYGEHIAFNANKG